MSRRAGARSRRVGLSEFGSQKFEQASRTGWPSRMTVRRLEWFIRIPGTDEGICALIPAKANVSSLLVAIIPSLSFPEEVR